MELWDVGVLTRRKRTYGWIKMLIQNAFAKPVSDLLKENVLELAYFEISEKSI